MPTIIEEKDLGTVIKANDTYVINYTEVDKFGCVNFDIFTFPEGFRFKNRMNPISDEDEKLAKHAFRMRLWDIEAIDVIINTLNIIKQKLVVKYDIK